MHQLREYGGDKLVVCFDPEEGTTLSLEVAYALARARVLMARGEADGIDPSAIRDAIERATGAMADVLRVKQQLTGAKTSIDKGAAILDAMATAVRAQLTQVELLLAAAEGDATDVAAAAAGGRRAPAEPGADGGLASASRPRPRRAEPSPATRSRAARCAAASRAVSRRGALPF